MIKNFTCCILGILIFSTGQNLVLAQVPIEVSVTMPAGGGEGFSFVLSDPNGKISEEEVQARAESACKKELTTAIETAMAALEAAVSECENSGGTAIINGPIIIDNCSTAPVKKLPGGWAVDEMYYVSWTVWCVNSPGPTANATNFDLGY